GKTALTATRGQTLHLWDVATGKPVGPPLPCDSARTEGVLTAAFRPDGGAAAASTMRPSRTSRVLTAVFPPDGGTVLAATRDRAGARGAAPPGGGAGRGGGGGGARPPGGGGVYGRGAGRRRGGGGAGRRGGGAGGGAAARTGRPTDEVSRRGAIPSPFRNRLI